MPQHGRVRRVVDDGRHHRACRIHERQHTRAGVVWTGWIVAIATGRRSVALREDRAARSKTARQGASRSRQAVHEDIPELTVRGFWTHRSQPAHPARGRRVCVRGADEDGIGRTAAGLANGGRDPRGKLLVNADHIQRQPEKSR